MPTADRVATPRLRGTGFEYLAVLLVGDVVAQVVNQVVPEDASSGGPSPALLVSVAALVVSGVLWWRYPGELRPTKSLRLFLGAAMGLWIVTFVATLARAESASVTIFLLLFLLAGLWLKPPSEDAALRAAEALGWALVGATLLTVALEASGVLPSWYDRADIAAAASWDRSFYWLPLGDALGLDGRWAGPFIHPNLAGPLGAALLVFGLTRAGVTRAVFVVVGAGILLLAGSRNSLVAAAAGISVIAVSWWLRRPGRLALWMRIVIAALPLPFLLAVLYVAEPTLGGRDELWPAYVRLWGDDRILGVGQGGIDDLINAGVLPGWAHHAHNVALDTLVRYGIVGLAVMICVIATGLVIVWSSARSGRAAGLALMAMLIVGGMADTILHWQYLTTPMMILLLAVLMSTGLGGRTRDVDQGPVENWAEDGGEHRLNR